MQINSLVIGVYLPISTCTKIAKGRTSHMIFIFVMCTFKRSKPLMM